ncbi:unnamed protein product [Camellia sinensis]
MSFPFPCNLSFLPLLSFFFRTLRILYSPSLTFQNLSTSIQVDAIATTITARINQKKKMPMMRQAFKSLTVALAVPLSLTMIIIFTFGSGPKYRALQKPFWFPRLWLIHVASLGSSFLMGMSAWLVWAEGGFHRQPDALPLYIAQVSLSLIWDPLVLKIGASHVGLLFCVVHFGTLVACYQKFRPVNPIAGAFVKPCLSQNALNSIIHKLKSNQFSPFSSSSSFDSAQKSLNSRTHCSYFNFHFDSAHKKL